MSLLLLAKNGFARADAARVRTVAGRRAQWQYVERGACLASVGLNVLQWVAR